jgi:hypothetical protein
VKKVKISMEADISDLHQFTGECLEDNKENVRLAVQAGNLYAVEKLLIALTPPHDLKNKDKIGALKDVVEQLSADVSLTNRLMKKIKITFVELEDK